MQVYFLTGVGRNRSILKGIPGKYVERRGARAPCTSTQALTTFATDPP
jgi:hypothetical protein